MVYRFTIISNEVEDFIREIKIDAEATFYDLHQAILSSCHYADNVPTSFFICNQEWEQEQDGSTSCWKTKNNVWSMFSTRWTTVCFSLN